MLAAYQKAMRENSDEHSEFRKTVVEAMIWQGNILNILATGAMKFMGAKKIGFGPGQTIGEKLSPWKNKEKFSPVENLTKEMRQTMRQQELDQMALDYFGEKAAALMQSEAP